MKSFVDLSSKMGKYSGFYSKIIDDPNDVNIVDKDQSEE